MNNKINQSLRIVRQIRRNFFSRCTKPLHKGKSYKQVPAKCKPITASTTFSTVMPK